MFRSKNYKCPYTIVYKSPRYGKTVTVPKGFNSDGASGPAVDIWSEGWWVHDKLCKTRTWDDGTYCSPWVRSVVLGDILRKEGRWFRAVTWQYATFAYEWVREKLTP